MTKTRRERIVEGVGSRGLTLVSVTRGSKQVNITTVYGVGAGAVVNVREEDKEVDEPSLHELDEVTQPLYDTCHTGFGLRDSKERVEAKVAAGFRVGARTYISKRG
ncbi:unnamed protein product [Sphagnum tenellum]